MASPVAQSEKAVDAAAIDDLSEQIHKLKIQLPEALAAVERLKKEVDERDQVISE